MTKIKLCGLTRQEDITAANVLEPDFVCFVVAPNIPRRETYFPPRSADWTIGHSR